MNSATIPTLPRLSAHRYVQPLREGGSLPAVVETGDGLFVVKFRGAGQGPKALVAELIVGLMARTLDLPVPELALVDVPPPFGRSEPDPEIQDLLRQSHGINVGIRYLDGAFNFDGNAAGDLLDEEFATRLVWLDALVTNPDRTHRNPNLLIWQRRPWLIDHGAALYAHHDWAGVDDERTRTPFPFIRDHVLLTRSGDIAGRDPALAALLDEPVLRDILDAVPDELLGGAESSAEARARYLEYLVTRLRPPRPFAAEITSARERRRNEAPQALKARR
ncbi:MAG TPA: HipA family kinase [Gemmatimonadales bacterium]|nr:HipA family kinase [Gemmatimonadales bacterium]